MNTLGSLVKTLLDFFGFGFKRHTDILLVEELMKDLRPLQTQHPLVRIGSEGDGGYLLPDCLDDITGVISPGVGDSSSFETFFADRGVPCVLIDGTVNAPSQAHPAFKFVKKMLAPDAKGTESLTLDDAVEILNLETGNLILQMDIEGGEWEVLRQVPLSTLRKFKILVVEFHEFDKRVKDAARVQQVKEAVQRLTHLFVPVHIHVNNCCRPRAMRAKGLRGLFQSVEMARVFEATFLRKTDAIESGDRSPVPHPLDENNVPKSRNRKTPALWKFDEESGNRPLANP